MTSTGQQTTFQDLNYLPVIQEQEVVSDTIESYIGYLTDSLNPPAADTLFRFELKEIVLPEVIVDADSLQPVYDKISLFSSGRKDFVKPETHIRVVQNTDWFTAIFLMCAIILAWIRHYYTRRIKQLFKAAFARHHVNQLIRDGNLTDERITPFLSFIYISGLSGIIWQLGLQYIQHVSSIENPFFIFLIIMAVVILFWLSKIMLIKFTGNIFRARSDISEYILTNVIFNISIGIVIFPFVVAGYYTENIMITYLALGLLGLGMLLRFFRSISVGLSAQSFSVVYLFLYLCTLEILPVLVLFRLITTTD